MDHFIGAAERLRKLATKYHGVLVAFSGGKDSLALMQLCCNTFRQVVGLHLEFLPGLEVVEKQIALAKSRWGVEIVRQPDPAFLKCYQIGEWNDVSNHVKDIKPMKGRDVYRAVALDLGFSLIATGMKRSDGMNNTGDGSEEVDLGGKKTVKMVNPLWQWRQTDVLAYLSLNKIPIPDSDGRKSASIDMTEPSIRWLWERHRKDYDLLEQYFPYMGAVVKRRELYGEAK